nr:type II toxin-antitoxin system RelE/ParE family toxin [Leucobacter exalbidus]
MKAAIHVLAEDSRPPGSLQMGGGNGELRIRVGDCRIIYDVRDDGLMILVL